MIPRRVIDLRWHHLAAALWHCAWPPRAAATAPAQALPFLSVRSGFDALLTALDLPRGSEVLLSAITVKDMVQIIEAHGLVPVALDVQAHTLAVDADELRLRCTPRSRMLLLAHLFGSRMPVDALAAVARERGLLLVEDCAQAFTGDGYRGHAQTDVAMFSFGPIKTATALGGGLLFVRDAALRERMAAVQRQWPAQGRAWFARRCAKYALLKLLSLRPAYTALCAALAALGQSHEAWIGRMTKNFRAAELLMQLRRRPPPALTQLMLRRWHEAPRSVGARMRSVQALDAAAPSLARPGAGAVWHTHWVAPVLCGRPEALAADLYARGFDASRGSSSMTVAGHAPLAAQWYAQVLYLPAHEACSMRDMQRLAQALRHSPALTPPLRSSVDGSAF